MQDNGGDRDVPDGDAPSGREEAAGVTGLYWRGRCAREPERGRPAWYGKAIHQTGRRGRASRRPSLICKAVGAIVAQNKMVEDGDADEVTGLTESSGEHTIFGTRRRIPGGMVMLCGVANYVEFLHTDASAPA